MTLDHEGLEVYQIALDFLVIANAIIEGLPRGRGHLSDQFTRASLSIVLNIAEGAGKHSKLDKRRYYLTARGSATESAALVDVCYRLKLLEEHTSTAMDSSFLDFSGTGTHTFTFTFTFTGRTNSGTAT
ncbi:MAG TPA: four helix bundle protein [Polyangiaceae bacterium]